MTKPINLLKFVLCRSPFKLFKVYRTVSLVLYVCRCHQKRISTAQWSKLAREVLTGRVSNIIDNNCLSIHETSSTVISAGFNRLTEMNMRKNLMLQFQI